jgi:hypothetical protein
MSFQNDRAALIHGGLNRFNVSIGVARSDHYGLCSCAYRPCQDDCESSDKSSSHPIPFHLSSFYLSFGPSFSLSHAEARI